MYILGLKHIIHQGLRKVLMMVCMTVCASVLGQSGLPLGDNLVVNGDFEQGDSGFVTDYTPTSQYIDGPGKYAVDNDVANHYNNQGSTTSMLGQGHSGKYMMINGSGLPQDIVWQQSLEVTNHTDYVFSVWVAHLWKNCGNDYTAQLKFYINGEALNYTPFVNSCTNANQRPNWQEFTANWNSGTSTMATITIRDINPNSEAGNDFGLDDISLREYLSVGPISRITPVCAGTSLELTPPELYCQGCSGQWEILQGNTVIHTSTANTLPNVPFAWNGCWIRYAVNYQGFWHYSNAVQLFVTQGLGVEIQFLQGDDSLCFGDTAILHAEVTNDVMFDFIAIGDILCTDGSTVHPADWTSCGKTAKGIVFYVDSTDVHGWAMGLTELDYVKWSNATGNIPGLQTYTQPRDAILDFRGKQNTEVIHSEDYPAAWYCISKGGYLPAIGQLNVFFGGLAEVNTSLNLVGGTPFATTEKGWFLLSSTVQSATRIYYIDRSGSVQSGNKDYTGSVYGNPPPMRIARPVFDF